MRSRIVVIVAVLGLAGLVSPRQARADSPIFDTGMLCTANLLSVCTDFNLTSTGTNSYQLIVEYLSSADGTGVMTAGGIYDPSGTFTFSDMALVALSPSLSDWGTNAGGSTDCQDLGNATYAWACAGTNGNDGLAPGGAFTITFTATGSATHPAITAADFGAGGELGFRSHMQSLGANGCSLKLDSRAPGNVVGGIASADAACGSPIPEPATLLLLGTGLLGLGGVQWIRRRRLANA